MSRRLERVSRNRSYALGAVVLVAGLTGAVASGGASSQSAPSLEQLVGRRLIVAMAGRSPSRSLLRRVARGQVGGVILFGGNVLSRPQLAGLTARLQRAAVVGGRPPLLVAVDQEGGAIRRLPWAPPGLSAVALGRRAAAASYRAGVATGKALRLAGVAVDLAPVADVPTPGSFLLRQERAFGTDPRSVTSRSSSFSLGLAAAGVLATAKHFPGLGRAHESTDERAVTIRAPRAALAARDLVPFRRAVATGIPLVMLSNASYRAFGNVPAAWSQAAVQELRGGLGFRGVTVTDALEALAATHGVPIEEAARRAAAAGVDALLLTGSERSTARVFDSLVADARAGRLPRASLRASYDRLLALARSTR